MKIGWISQALPYLPSRGGFRLYGGNLIPALAKRHQIDLVSLLVDDDEKHLGWAEQYCASITTIPTTRQPFHKRLANLTSSYLWGKSLHYRDRLTEILDEGLRAGRWDVLHIEGPFAGGIVPTDLPIAKVLSLHDSWTLRCEEMVKCSQNYATNYTINS